LTGDIDEFDEEGFLKIDAAAAIAAQYAVEIEVLYG
jgi:hypothetical protein